MRLEKLMSFYVYRLIDPRDGSTFYIGKGTRKRAWSHESDARAGRVGNKPKHNRIMAIVGASLAVGVEVVASFQDERLAYAHEWDLIQNTSDLTNIIGANSKDSEPPPTPDEIRRARVEAKRQQLQKQREFQYGRFVERLPANVQGVAYEWVSGLRENATETIMVKAKRLGKPATPWEVVGPEKKRKRKLRRKYRPARPFEIEQIRVPPKI